MLEKLVLPMRIGTAYGSGALKALQNDSLPELDLLVREAIQNSADAALEQEGDSVNINFKLGTFSGRLFNDEISGLTDMLNARFGLFDANYLEIRDYKTSGLTGPVNLTDLTEDHGNYYKLLFDTGKEQTNSDAGQAGGSWGYGKSVYYRVGVGFVVFYTQIKTGERYESRLLISFIEDETDSCAMLKSVTPNAVGRAWWGKRVDDSEDDIRPVTDKEEIERILNIFGIKPFKEAQTGTSIIIPYINKVRLLTGIFPEDCGISQEEIAMCAWKDDIAEYIKLAVQKWYAPRLFNKHLNNFVDQKWLSVRINDEIIRNSDMRPFFRLVQELYNTAISRNAGISYASEIFKNIRCVEIPSSRVEGKNAGCVATVRVFRNELNPTGAMISPYTYLRMFAKSPLNDPIVMYARTAGMVLYYRIDGEWTKGMIKPENDDEYIVSFYVPKCDSVLKQAVGVTKYAGMPLGEYLRKCEKSDHVDWIDKAEMTVASNIKIQVINKVNAELKVKDDIDIEGATSKLAGRLGKRLLPSLKYGKRPVTGGGGSGTGGGHLDDLEFTYSILDFSSEILEMDFCLKFKNNRKRVDIEIFVVDDNGGKMDANTWKTEIGTRFPLEIISIFGCKTVAVNSGKLLEIESECNRERQQVRNEFTRLQLCMSSNAGTAIAFAVINQISNAVVSGRLKIATSDKRIGWTIAEIKKTEVM